MLFTDLTFIFVKTTIFGSNLKGFSVADDAFFFEVCTWPLSRVLIIKSKIIFVTILVLEVKCMEWSDANKVLFQLKYSSEGFRGRSLRSR